MAKTERDQAMERISAGLERCSQSVAEIKRIIDVLAERRGELRRPHLTLVTNDDEEGDDG